MSRAAPRGWRAVPDPVTGNYQAACGHYIEAGVYACIPCNIAPLEDVQVLRRALSDLVDSAQRGTLEDIARTVGRAEQVLESLD